jgi:hypothetical protein
MIQLLFSERPDKRFVAIYEDKVYYFGSPTGTTFIDGATEKQKDNYKKRHYANAVEKHRIDNLIMSPALLSWYLLWNTRDLAENVRLLEGMLATT